MGRNRCQLVLSLLLVLMTVSAPVVAYQVGRIEYIHGHVDIIRDGSIIDSREISPGEPVFAMDLIQTGHDGYAEVELSVMGLATIRISENTAYYVEAEPRTGGGTRGRVRVLSGSVGMAVRRLERTSSLDVETRSVVVGVRGTEFDILAAPDESVLVGVRSGQVEVAASGRQARLQSGRAAEIIPDRTPTVRTVPDGDFEVFYSDWREVRLNAFRSGAPTFVVAYVRRFRDTEPAFRDAYQELMRYRDRLRRAVDDAPAGPGVDMRLRSEVSPAIIRMRSILPLFENTVYRLRELERFHRQGIGVTRIDNESSADFFHVFSREERRLMQQLSEVRSVFRDYQRIEQRSFGGLPGGDSPFGGSSILDSMRF